MAGDDEPMNNEHNQETKPRAAAAPVEQRDIKIDDDGDFEDLPESLRDILDAPVVAHAVTAWHEVTSKQVQLAKLQSDRAYELENRRVELQADQSKREHEIDLRRMDIARGNAWAARVIAGAVLLGVAGLFVLYPNKPEIAIDVAKGIAVIGGAFGAGWAWKRSALKSGE